MTSTLTINKDSSAMARARELNRTNERRLSDCITSMSKDVEKSLQNLKLEGETTIKFMKNLKNTTGKSNFAVQPLTKEDENINLLINPPPKMTFALIDYKKKKLKELSKRLTAPNITLASEGNPVPIRTVHSWTSSTARLLGQKKPPQVARPTGRRHSVESDDDSSNDDELFSLQTLKKKAGQKRLKELAKRRSSLPIILEKKVGEIKPAMKERNKSKSNAFKTSFKKDLKSSCEVALI